MTNYYVSTTGNDTNNGTSVGTPFLTIQHAVDQAGAGDTVNVASGTYNETVVLTNNGSAGNIITLKATTPLGAKIVSTGDLTFYTTILCNGDYWKIIGFDISGGYSRGIRIKASFITVQGNYIHDIGTTTIDGGGGIQVTDYTTSDITIIGNFVTRVALPALDSLIHGIYVASLRNVVQNNIIVNCGGTGIITNHAGTSLTFSNNAVLACGAGIGINSSTVTVDNSIISNNIIVDCDIFGNNQLYEQAGLTVGSNNQFLNNCIWGAFHTGVRLNSPNTDVGTLAHTPQLANYQQDGTGNYRLAKGSVCIGAGVSSGAPSTDYDGHSRLNSKIDIGPYQFTPFFSTVNL